MAADIGRIEFSVFSEHDFAATFSEQSSLRRPFPGTLRVKAVTINDLFALYNTHITDSKRLYSSHSIEEIVAVVALSKTSPHLLSVSDKTVMALKGNIDRVSFDLLSILHRDVSYQIEKWDLQTGKSESPIFFSGFSELPENESDRIDLVLSQTTLNRVAKRYLNKQWFTDFAWEFPDVVKLEVLLNYVLKFAQVYKTWTPLLDLNKSELDEIPLSNQTLKNIKAFVDTIVNSILSSIWTYAGAYSHYNVMNRKSVDWNFNVKFQLEWNPGVSVPITNTYKGFEGIQDHLSTMVMNMVNV